METIRSHSVARRRLHPPSTRADSPISVRATAATPTRHLSWLAGGIILSFLVPYAFADRLGLPRDLYYGIYVAAVVGLCAGWMRDTGQSPRELLARRWRWAVALGVLFAVASVLLVVRTENATSHPGGIEFIGAIVWRGVVYGAADGLLLTAFPILVVFAALSRGRLRRRRGGLVAVGAVALGASLLLTATYHLGYSDFRSAKVRKPMTGDLLWSPPTLATLNPVGAPIVHAAMHVAAVTHSYETDLFLPPH